MLRQEHSGNTTSPRGNLGILFPSRDQPSHHAPATGASHFIGPCAISGWP